MQHFRRLSGRAAQRGQADHLKDPGQSGLRLAEASG